MSRFFTFIRFNFKIMNEFFSEENFFRIRFIGCLMHFQFYNSILTFASIWAIIKFNQVLEIVIPLISL